MNRKIIGAGSIFICAAISIADVFPVEYQNIKKLKPVEAEAAYIKLAEKTNRPVQKDHAYLAAVSQALAVGNAENAKKHMALIKDEIMRDYARMKIMDNQRQWTGLAEFARGFDLTTWPDALIPEAAILRGKARAQNKDIAGAEADLRLAIDSTAPQQKKYVMIYRVGNVYATLIKDPAKEVTLLREAMPLEEGVWHLYRQRVNCRYAELLAATGQIDEGIRSLEEYAPKCDAAPVRQFNIKITLGDLYLKKNDLPKAEAFYKEAAAIPKLSEPNKKTAEDRLLKIKR